MTPRNVLPFGRQESLRKQRDCRQEITDPTTLALMDAIRAVYAKFGPERGCLAVQLAQSAIELERPK